MSKEVISVGGEERVVREDTAKSYRGVIWAFLSVGAFLVIALVLFFSGFFASLSNGDVKTPAEIEQKRQ